VNSKVSYPGAFGVNEIDTPPLNTSVRLLERHCQETHKLLPSEVNADNIEGSLFAQEDIAECNTYSTSYEQLVHGCPTIIEDRELGEDSSAEVYMSLIAL